MWLEKRKYEDFNWIHSMGKSAVRGHELFNTPFIKHLWLSFLTLPWYVSNQLFHIGLHHFYTIAMEMILTWFKNLAKGIYS